MNIKFILCIMVSIIMFLWGFIHVELAIDKYKEHNPYWLHLSTGLIWIFASAPTILRAGWVLSERIFNLG